MSINTKLSELIEISEQIIDKLAVNEIDFEAVTQLENLRNLKLKQLFNSKSVLTGPLTRKELNKIVELDNKIEQMALNKKDQFAKAIIAFKNKNKVSTAYKKS